MKHSHPSEREPLHINYAKQFHRASKRATPTDLLVKKLNSQLDIKFQPGLPIFFPMQRDECTCLPAPLQLFVFQLDMSQGSVPKSGLKLLQMFSNHRLQCQHKPTSAFVYCIYRFDVTQMNCCKS